MSDTYPIPESVMILHREFAPDATLAVVCEGKHLMFQLNRRQVFLVMSQACQALADMEPHRKAGAI